MSAPHAAPARALGDYFYPLAQSLIPAPARLALGPSLTLYIELTGWCADWNWGGVTFDRAAMCAQLAIGQATYYRYLNRLAYNTAGHVYVRLLPVPYPGGQTVILADAVYLRALRAQLAPRARSAPPATPPQSAPSAPYTRAHNVAARGPAREDSPRAALLAARDAKLAELRGTGWDVD